MLGSDGQCFGKGLTVVCVEEVNDVAGLLVVGNFVEVRDVLHLVDRGVDFDLGDCLRLDVVLDLIVFAFEVFEHCGLLDDVVGELLPLHVPVPVDVDLVEEVGEVPD